MLNAFGRFRKTVEGRIGGKFWKTLGERLALFILNISL